MTGTPEFAYTVVIPAFNAARTLAEAIQSALHQTVAPRAITVVDDGSSDDTPAIACSFRKYVTLISQAHSGPAEATDRGLAGVQTPFVAGLDADDLWLPQKIERQVARLHEVPALDAVFCRAYIFRHGSAPATDGPAQDLWGRSTMLMRMEAARRIGPVAYEADPVMHGEMIRWLYRGRRLGLTFEMMSEVLGGRRIIEGSLSYGQDASALLPLLRQRLRRRTSDTRAVCGTDSPPRANY